MKHSFILFAALLLLAVLSASIAVDGKNCKKTYRCVPTITPTVVRQIVFYPVSQVQGVSTTSGWVCRLFGTQTWFACKPYSVRLPSGQILYGFIRA